MAEFHPKLSEEHAAAREMSLKLEAMNYQSAMKDAVAELEIMKYMNSESQTEYLKLPSGFSAIGNRRDGTIEVIGNTYYPVEPAETCVTLDGVVTSLKPSDLIAGNATDFEDIRKAIADVTGIPSSLLKQVTIVTQEAAASPDMTIDVGAYTEPGDPASEQIFSAVSAMRHQAESPNLRFVNRCYESED